MLGVDRLGEDARRHVRDARDREAAEAHVPGREHLGHGRHPDEIAPSARIIRISAGVSNAGPSHAA